MSEIFSVRLDDEVKSKPDELISNSGVKNKDFIVKIK